MELKQYFHIIYKRLWIVILLTVIAGLSAAYASFYLLNPVYESNTTLYVLNTRISPQQISIAYDDVMVGQMLVKDYRELIKSRTVTGTVIKEMGLSDLTDLELADKVSVNLKNDTRIFEIKVQDVSPGRAREIADKFAEIFIKRAIQLMKVENVEVIDKAQVPLLPIRPRPLINIAIAVTIGMLSSIGIIFLIEYLDDTIKTNADVEQRLGLTVIGTIPVMNIK